jgi:hypothetical protein
MEEVNNETIHVSQSDKESSSSINSSKRSKPSLIVDYPTSSVLIPTRGVIESVYNEAMQVDDDDQKELNKFGLLSFANVLLPAVAHQEERAIKTLSSTVQRQHPELVDAFVELRKAIYDSVMHGMTAAKKSKEARALVETEREKEWALQKKWADEKEREQVAMKQAAALEVKTLKRKARKKEKMEAMKKQLPRNQDLCRELAYLLCELEKLRKEEKAWMDALETVQAREVEMRVAHEAAAKALAKEAAATKEMKHEPVQELTLAKEAIENVTLSANRIQNLLTRVSTLTTESDNVRKELYQRYRKDHQFRGYPGVKDPKGLLRALSQPTQSQSQSVAFTQFDQDD